jgi:hypothetical protein
MSSNGAGMATSRLHRASDAAEFLRAERARIERFHHDLGFLGKL